MPVADHANIAQHLPHMAAHQPTAVALKVPRGRSRDGRIDYLALDFSELSREAAAWQALMTTRGIRRGDRVLVMVRPGLPLIGSVFALFGLGAVPVVIDPGMGLRSFLAAVSHTRPRALVGIPLARLVSRVCRRAFSALEIRVPAPHSPVARQRTIEGANFTATATGSGELAAILFTSGSTGTPKGVCYTHGMFAAQVAMICDTYGIEPGERDLPMLPVFALFNPALGMTTVVPEIDPARPAKMNPEWIVQAIRQEAITSSFGSPTLWSRIARHCEASGIVLPSLRRVLCAGAPVPAALWSSLRAVLPNGELHSPYGATEALPVSNLRGREVNDEIGAASRKGQGTCVGDVVAGNNVRIIAIDDGPISTLQHARQLPVGEVGEIIVSGPSVTHAYDRLPEATALAKIAGEDGVIWHRMGDCGRFDTRGRLWFSGRKAERVETASGNVFTEEVEPLFRAHPAVERCALIGLGPRGQQEAALVVERRRADRGSVDDAALARELKALAAARPHAGRIRRIFFHPSLPVDVRHNAKIHRLKLARWATGKEGFA